VLIDETDELAVMGCIRSGQLSGSAEVVRQYERSLARYFGTRFAAACSSGTAAIQLALQAVGVESGHEVVVPATAPVMTALAAVAVGAKPVFVDTRAGDSFALDMSDLERRRTRATKAVLSVPMWGYPSDGMELVRACRDWGVALIEDAAQAQGARIGGRYVGTLGTIGTSSTHENKLVTTGEGGFCLTNDAAVYTRLCELRNFGRAVRLDEPIAIPFGEFGASFGTNLKLGALASALGTTQLAKLESRVADRRIRAHRLIPRLQEVPGLRALPVPLSSEPSYYALVLVCSDKSARRLAVELGREAGIISDTVRYDYKPLYRTAVFSNHRSAPCTNAESLCASILTLPCHEGLSVEDENSIVEACRRVAISPVVRDSELCT
jgi:dTDP-4-amino-4,6-dideoxygalactose transaminase